MTDEQRAEHGITERLPRSLGEALETLATSQVLGRVLGPDVVREYIVTRKAEMEKLDSMTEEVRRAWLIERY